MLTAQDQILRDVDKQTVVSLREKDRRDESTRREHVLKDQRDAFLRAQGVEPIDTEAEDVDEEALEKQQKIIDRIQANEAARILADSIRLGSSSAPRAVMRY
jgi:carboxyl-terminal processing protease